MYATGVGLALFGAAQGRGRAQTRFRIRDDSIFGRVKQRMRDWFYEFDLQGGGDVAPRARPAPCVEPAFPAGAICSSAQQIHANLRVSFLARQ